MRLTLGRKIALMWLISTTLTICAPVGMRQLGIQGWPVYAVGLPLSALTWWLGYVTLIRKIHR